MMNYDAMVSRLNSLGYRKSTGVSHTDDGMTIIDFQKGRKGMQMFSAYLNQDGSVQYLEKTKLQWNEVQGRYVPRVERIYGLSQLV